MGIFDLYTAIPKGLAVLAFEILIIGCIVCLGWLLYDLLYLAFHHWE